MKKAFLAFALALLCVLALPAAVPLAGPSAAGRESLGKTARPGRPVAKAPKGTITDTQPTFTWSKVKGVTGYEVRIYVNGQLALTTTVTLPSGSSVHSCHFPGTSELTKYNDDSWKVRASNAAGNGPWSKTLHFTVH
jgi:hypothetical protein